MLLKMRDARGFITGTCRVLGPEAAPSIRMPVLRPWRVRCEHHHGECPSRIQTASDTVRDARSAVSRVLCNLLHQLRSYNVLPQAPIRRMAGEQESSGQIPAMTSPSDQGTPREAPVIRLDGLPYEPEESGPSGPAGPSDTDVMKERLARLEGAFEGLKLAIDGLRHSQNMTLTAVMGVGVILAGIGIYILQRVDALPGEFEHMNQTLSAAITAAKQAPPEVILMPAPQTLPPQQQKEQPKH